MISDVYIVRLFVSSTTEARVIIGEPFWNLAAATFHDFCEEKNVILFFFLITYE